MSLFSARSTPLVREIRRTYQAKQERMLCYCQNAIAFSCFSHTVSGLFEELAAEELHHTVLLGAWLLRQGVAPSLQARGTPTPPLSGTDKKALSLAAAAALSREAERARAETRELERLEKEATEADAARLLHTLAEKTGAHAHALSRLYERYSDA